MDQYYRILIDMPFFNNVSISRIPDIIRCLDGYIKDFEKEQIVYDYHNSINYAGIVLEGEIGIIMLNHSGNQHNICKYLAGELFGEAYACVTTEKSIVQIVANEKSKVLFLKFENLFKENAIHCPYASRVTSNLLREIAKKNIYQNMKIEILTQKYIRERLIVFLCSCKREDNTILIPYNRQDWASYLGVERSALSRELSKMKSEGLIDYDKNKITLISNKFLCSL
ncbi:Crp/Fnr family transcriptional regulator [Petroclostridium sp. X23]|uniref:Crp/Fnr family transcriptional regulator n=1 Tax=Petroclostridium sp. X23 TaxID=3045146 RepID=UPI0024ADB5B0|nr:Crp/Fnr family transcriptional regulator [Petroclostridium sp. X23]WHH58685.1 Crp/Fnr family transcriptional regulator [Petroclostridium sp. X23]